ncbi:hypothetical protein ANO14919_143470 [Xylariales sp. No.14919]|nr:hypothetical protein ANO14919_143470 [Xylariales sp. No.14919]
MSDEKQKARTAELMAQLKGAEYEERDAEVRRLAERGHQLNRSIQRKLAEAQQIIYGAAPGSPISRDSEPRNRMSGREHRKGPRSPSPGDSESDDGRIDETYLTDDGGAVIEEKYQLINGHWALITSRKKLSEVDPYLLLELQAKHERKLAGVKGKRMERGRDVPELTHSPEPASPMGETEVHPEVSRWREASVTIDKKANVTSRGKSQGGNHTVEDEDDLDIWLRIADEEE